MSRKNRKMKGVLAREFNFKMENFASENLIEKLQSGDETAFHALFDRFYASLCLFARKYIDDGDTAEDLAQEAFLKYWDKRAGFDDLYKVKSFLYIVVRNACLNHIRDNRKKLPVSSGLQVESDDRFIEWMMEEEAYRILYHAVEDLPKQMRTVVFYALDGLKNAEIAGQMQLSVHAVNAYKKRAYKKLKESLKEHFFLIEILSLLIF